MARIIERTSFKMDSKGRLVIPKSFREVGAEYVLTAYEDKVVIHKKGK